MASKFLIVGSSQDSAVGVKNYFNLNSPVESMQRVAKYIMNISSGSVSGGTLVIGQTAVSATGTVTFASFVAADTVTVGQIVLTGSASPANENQFLSTGTDAQDAAAFAACVNAHSILSKIVSASSLLAVATVTSIIPGVIGNQLDLAISAHGSVSAATFTGGSIDTNVTLAH